MATDTAVAYYRTSSAANVGEEKDSLPRQREAVVGYAKAHGLTIVREFYDAAVSGADAVDIRPGFAEMLSYITGNGARVVLVENAGRFARDLAVQIAGHDLLKSRGITLIAADAPEHFTESTPTATMVRNILGAVSQFEKAILVERMRKARERRRVATGKCEGRKSHAELRPEAVKLVKRLRRRSPRTGRRMAYRDISEALEARGHVSSTGKPFGPSAILSMLRGSQS